MGHLDFLTNHEFLCSGLITALIVIMGLLIYILLLKRDKQEESGYVLDLKAKLNTYQFRNDRQQATINNMTSLVNRKSVELPERILKQLDDLEEQIKLQRCSLEARGFPFREEIDLSIVAKVMDLGVGPNQLFEILRKEKILMEKGDFKNMPFQKYMTQGYLKVIKEPYKQGPVRKIHYKPVCTPKGLNFIRKVVEKHLAHNHVEEKVA